MMAEAIFSVLRRMAEVSLLLLGANGSFFHLAPGLCSGSAGNRDCCKTAFRLHLEEESSLQLDPFREKLSSTSDL